MNETSSASSGASELFLERAPIKLFFNLNFSSQLVLKVVWVSGLLEVAENACAVWRIKSSDRGTPFFSCIERQNGSHVFHNEIEGPTWFFAHTARARSMSGDRPLGRLAGDRLPSSWKRYFSFCRSTLETVLRARSVTFSITEDDI